MTNIRVKLSDWNAREQFFLKDGTCITKKGFVEIDSENEEFERWNHYSPKMFIIEDIIQQTPIQTSSEPVQVEPEKTIEPKRRKKSTETQVSSNAETNV